MTFEEFAEEKEIRLQPWQRIAATKFLKEMYKYRGSATGKTFLINLLSDFISEHGNIYELERR